MMLTKILLPLIVAAIAIFAGVFVVRKRNTLSPKLPTQTNEPKVSGEEQISNTGLTGSLIVVMKGGQIERVNLADGRGSQLTKDPSLRLAKTAPGAKQLITVTTATASTANLNLYDPASGKTTKLAELSLSGAPPIVSPDGKQYLSASFSNFEVEFGWHVYLNTVGSSNKKEVFSTPESLTNVTFSPEASKIAFVVSRGKGGSEVTVVDLKTEKKGEIYTTNAEILSLAWGGSTIFFVEAPAKKGQANLAELYQMTEAGKDKKQLTTNDRAENFVAAAADGAMVAFLDLSYSSGNVTPETTGTVSVLDLKSSKVQTYGEAVQVAGFESSSE